MAANDLTPRLELCVTRASGVEREGLIYGLKSLGIFSILDLDLPDDPQDFAYKLQAEVPSITDVVLHQLWGDLLETQELAVRQAARETETRFPDPWQSGVQPKRLPDISRARAGLPTREPAWARKVGIFVPPARERTPPPGRAAHSLQLAAKDPPIGLGPSSRTYQRHKPGSPSGGGTLRELHPYRCKREQWQPWPPRGRHTASEFTHAPGPEGNQNARS